MTLDKLPAIRGDLVRMDPEWEKWNFAQLSEAVRLWTKRNPVEERETSEQLNWHVVAMVSQTNAFIVMM